MAKIADDPMMSDTCRAGARPSLALDSDPDDDRQAINMSCAGAQLTDPGIIVDAQVIGSSGGFKR